MTRIGMNMLLWTGHVTEEHTPILENIKAEGFTGVEIPVVEGDETHYTAIKQVLDRIGLECTTVSVLSADKNPVSPDPAIRQAALDHMKWAIDMSVALGSKILVGPFHSAWKEFTGFGPTADELGWCAEVLRSSAEYAGERGIRIGLEFLNRFECYLLNTTEDTRRLVEAVDHPALGILYDTHHANLEEKNVDTAIRAGGKRINHIHISENDRGVPGSGLVQWKETFAALKAIDYDGWLVIEAFSRLDPDFAGAVHIWRDYFDSPDDVYRDGIRFINRMLAD